MKRSLCKPCLGSFFLLALLLLVCGEGLCAETGSELGTVTGCVEQPGNSSYRGVASLWSTHLYKGPDPRLAIRPPAVSSPIGIDGCFTLQSIPGEYYVGAVLRMTERGWQGPPSPGDLVFLSPDAQGKMFLVRLSAGKTTDIGKHATGWRYTGFTSLEGTTTITGRLTDPDGRPLAGLLVFAFTDEEMSREPFAVSEPSDNLGRYLLRLPEATAVYLRVRESYGRRNPLAGGYVGVYGDSTPLPVTADGQSRDLTVFLIPAQRDPSKQPSRQPPSVTKP